MPRYKNEKSVLFFKDGTIEPIIDIDYLLDRCTSARHKILLLLLHLTGARTSEILLLQSNDIIKEGKYLMITIHTLKRGRKRRLPIPLSATGKMSFYARMLLRLVENTYLDGQRLFVGWYVVKVHRFIIKISGGDLIPQFFRHNMMSLLSMRGASMSQIQYWKGAKDIKSVQPYVHISLYEQTKTGDLLSKV